MKKFHLCLLAVATFMMVSCVKDADPNSEPTWIPEQQQTIQSLHMLETVSKDNGCLYEINYTADYRLDSVLQCDGAYLLDAIDNIKKTILPNSEWVFTFDLSKIPTGLGCSCFSAPSSSGGYILGRNYDFPPMDEHSLIIHTPQVKDADGNIIRHATVGCADLAPVANFFTDKRGYTTNKMKEFLLYSPYFILDGINDAGLMCGLMILEYDGTFQTDGSKKNLLNVMIPRLILDKCTTVEQAVNLIQQYKVQTMFATSSDHNYCIDMHFVIADKSGDRVLVEWVNNEICVMRPGDDSELPEQTSNDYILATNFYLASDPEACPEDVNELGFWRYDVLDGLLAINSNPSQQEAMNMCKAVKITQNDEDAINMMNKIDPLHTNWDDRDKWPWITLWSEVYDTQNLSMIFCSREEYDTPITIPLEYQK